MTVGVIMKPTIIFIHIPKTAGSTLARVFKSNYVWWPRRKVFVADSTLKEGPLEKYSDAQLRSVRLVHGHVAFGIHAYFPQPCVYVTYLRDPIKRLVSFYNYIHEEPRHYLYEQVATAGMTMEEFLTSDMTIELDNLQVRMLTGTEKSVPFGALTEVHYKQALDNINAHFAFVGITEHFDESLLMMRDAISWNFFPLYVRAMTGSRTGRKPCDLSPDALRLMEERNRFDVRLYTEIKARVEQRIAAGGLRFQERVQRYRKWNRCFQGLMRHLPVYKR
jgi:hypothetical protein